jgi:ADP-ribose pyrophosphatase YjhB (NUDIX family)
MVVNMRPIIQAFFHTFSRQLPAEMPTNEGLLYNRPMPHPTPPRWLDWAREIQALAQTGLHYAPDDYHRQRYRRLAEIAAEIASEHTQLAFEPLREAFLAELGYATPKVDVRAAVFVTNPPGLLPGEINDQVSTAASPAQPAWVEPVETMRPQLLMVRERGDGGWTLPGGWADVGDVPSEAAERETWEEAGFRVKARKLIGVYDANRVGPLEFNHAFKLVFLCELLDGTPTPSDETSEVTFFAQEEIPTFLSGERTRPRHIADAFAAWQNPDVPTIFD